MAQHGRASIDGPLEQCMSPRPDLGPKPRLGYAESSLERATERRADASALAAFADDQHARAYLVVGDLVILNSRWRKRARSAARWRSSFSGCAATRRDTRLRSSRKPPRRSKRTRNSS